MNILDFANNIGDFRQEVKVQHQTFDILLHFKIQHQTNRMNPFCDYRKPKAIGFGHTIEKIEDVVVGTSIPYNYTNSKF